MAASRGEFEVCESGRLLFGFFWSFSEKLLLTRFSRTPDPKFILAYILVKDRPKYEPNFF
jgi:hypothetical protein